MRTPYFRIVMAPASSYRSAPTAIAANDPTMIPLLAFGIFKPLVRIGGPPGIHIVARPGISRRIDDALDVTAQAEHEFGRSTEQLAGAIAGAPWRDVVGDFGNDEFVVLNPCKVDRRAKHR